MNTILNLSDYGIDALYKSGLKVSRIMQIYPWEDKVVVEKACYHGCEKKMFVWALLNLIFIGNDEEDPRVNVDNTAITPDVVKWYGRASEFEESLAWDADDDDPVSL